MTSAADTIYALASAPGRAGVAVLRISGRRVREICETLAGVLPPPRRAALVKFCAPVTAEVIDQGLLLFFPGPHSYTGEDMAEFQVHGGRAVLSALSQALASLGARHAEPGEFTRRAVINGKIDLSAAEGVADLVDAETEAQRKQALRQLDGALRDLTQTWRAELTRLEAHLAAAIDFADDDLPPGLMDDVRRDLLALQADLNHHLEQGHRGERLREGVYAVIIGAPNAGKSSLLNRLARRDVAIVTPLAGTTRDILEVPLDVGGYPLTLADTAGLREAVDVVEQEGVRRALARAAEADFKILVLDSTVADSATLAHYAPGDVVVLNKVDLAPQRATNGPIPISAKTGEGIPQLLAALAARAEEVAGLSASPTLTRARHREAIAETVESLSRALSAPQIDLMAEDLRLASRALGRITGQVGIEDLLDVIFRDFCLGK